MKTRAAVAFEAKKPLEIVEVDLEGPRAGEVLGWRADRSTLPQMIGDAWRWHQTGGCLHVPDNITLLPPPPYSPELNPVENV